MHYLIAASVTAAYFLTEIVCAIRLKKSSARSLNEWRQFSQSQSSRLLRQELVDSLASRLYYDPAYIFLQRMTLIAPLAGVIITAIGFVTLSSASVDPDEPVSILTAIKPLYLGVLVGAILAFLHQFCLQWASGCLGERQRMGEDELPDLVDNPVESALSGIARRLDGAADDFAERLAGTAEDAVNQFSSITADLARLTQAIDDVTIRCDAGGKQLEKSASSFGTSLQSSFQSLDKRFMDLGASLETAGGNITKAGDAVQSHVKSCEETMRTASSALKASVAPFPEMLSAVTAVTEHVTAAQEQGQAVDVARTQALEEMLSSYRGLSDNIARLGPAIDIASERILDASNRHLEASEGVARVTSMLDEAMTGAVREITGLEARMATVADRVRETREDVREAREEVDTIEEDLRFARHESRPTGSRWKFWRRRRSL